MGHTDGRGDSSLEAKVLTVSDGVVEGTRQDRSGQALEAYLTGPDGVWSNGPRSLTASIRWRASWPGWPTGSTD